TPPSARCGDNEASSRVHLRLPVQPSPSPVAARWRGLLLGLCTRLHTPPLPAAHASVGTDLDTDPRRPSLDLLSWTVYLRWSGFVSHWWISPLRMQGVAGPCRTAVAAARAGRPAFRSGGEQGFDGA